MFIIFSQKRKNLKITEEKLLRVDRDEMIETEVAAIIAVVGMIGIEDAIEMAIEGATERAIEEMIAE